MEPEKRPYHFPNVLLVMGMITLLIGGFLLMWTSGYLVSIGALWPAIFVIGGAILLYLVFVRRVTEFYIFPGMFMALGGLYFLLGESFLPWKELIKIWPVFMAIAGISLIPYGLSKRGNSRFALVIPGVAILVLAVLFMPFSLGMASLRFSRFVVMWWPALLVALGLVLLVSHFTRGKSGKD